MKLPRTYYNPISLFGTILSAVSALIIFFFIIAMIFFEHGESGSYIGLFIYIVLPVFLIIGLILIPVGMSRRSKRIKREGEGSPAPYQISFLTLAIKDTGMPWVCLLEAPSFSYY